MHKYTLTRLIAKRQRIFMIIFDACASILHHAIVCAYTKIETPTVLLENALPSIQIIPPPICCCLSNSFVVPTFYPSSSHTPSFDTCNTLLSHSSQHKFLSNAFSLSSEWWTLSWSLVECCWLLFALRFQILVHGSCTNIIHIYKNRDGMSFWNQIHKI